MTVIEYIDLQLPERREVMNAIHNIIMVNDQTVTPIVEMMMGKEMIIYKERNYMKYALSGVKQYMSLHCLPIYGSPVLHAKYAGLLPEAKLQKGCINFTSADQFPMNIASSLISDCSKISIADMLENRKKKK